MRRGRDDASDGVKSVLSGLSWPLAAVMPVTLCGPAPCLVKRDGQNPVRSLTPLGPPSFGGIRDRQRPKRVIRVSCGAFGIGPVYYRLLPSQRAYQAGTVGQEPTFRSQCE